MLIEFSVCNYRSIRDTATLSLVADSDKKIPENIIDVDIPGMKNTRLLKGAVLYGANASGKSNVYKAGAFMQDFVVNSARNQPGDPIKVTPFAFDPKLAQEPSLFEAIFVHEGVRYQYGFAVDAERVHEEWLIAYPKGKPQEWYRRKLKTKGKKIAYDWTLNPTYLKGAKKSLSDRTIDNRLFLSFAAGDNHEQLSKVYEWFRLYFRFLDLSMLSNLGFGVTAPLLHSGPDAVQALLPVLREADLGIEGVSIKIERTSNLDNFRKMVPKNVSESVLRKVFEKYKGKDLFDISFQHRADSSKGKNKIEFIEESIGTKKFFNILGPWYETLKNGYTLFIDELASNMHPMLIQNLLGMLKNTNSGAQVILTSHQTSLLSDKLFRRDQVWFTEKGEEEATALYPLTDYKPRPDVSLEKGYLSGRYGGIPFLPEEFTF